MRRWLVKRIGQRLEWICLRMMWVWIVKRIVLRRVMLEVRITDHMLIVRSLLSGTGIKRRIGQTR